MQCDSAYYYFTLFSVVKLITLSLKTERSNIHKNTHNSDLCEHIDKGLLIGCVCLHKAELGDNALAHR